MSNRLAAESSPYLRQHAGNPVDWWPWGDDAFAEARRSDRPVLLSVGYSACHWCHVMAHESFENAQIAALMNELFVNIKVDREERPDVDSVYMQAVQAMTGQGGWPMTVFLTPQGLPFYGGTYFPPEDRMGMRGFPAVLRMASEAFHTQKDAVAKAGEQLRQAITPPRLRVHDVPASVETIDEAARALVAMTDRRNGGFGSAPKFPHSAAIDVLLRRHRATGDRSMLDAALLSLDRMARGGIYDHLGGGFHRYSVDAQWAVPHFEKMLYDNAQLAPVYLHAYQLTGDERWRRVVEETLDYVVREMRLPAGGFASTQDADSEGEEGRFFAWTPEQLQQVLGHEDATVAARIFGVTDGGNFEHGTTVLAIPYPLDQVAQRHGVSESQLRERLDGMRARLFAAREHRVHPGRDDKVVTSWNAMMLSAFAEAGAALQRPDYVQVAVDAASFLRDNVMREGVLLRTWKDGEAKITGFLEDVAFLAGALLTLYEATGDARWFHEARRLADDMVERFHDDVSGFYDTAIDAEPLLVRPKSLDDNAVPAGQSIAAHALLRLYAYTGEDRWRRVAESVVGPLAVAVTRSPLGLGNLAWALELLVAPPREIAIAGARDAEDTTDLVHTVAQRFDPLRVLAWGDPDGVPLLSDRPTVDGSAAAYVCRNFACERPVTTREDLAKLLDAPA
ncbi:MAG TPA: thioredoxin domain-containing protein [Candidatus Dormibacteraeota bacterium]|nr:thioredoxin domain-containing protein [Candidatus Dormibacteraeota bacterium]